MYLKCIINHSAISAFWSIWLAPHLKLFCIIIHPKCSTVSHLLLSPGIFFITIWRLPYLEDESNIPSIRRYRAVHMSRNEQKNLKSFNERSQSRKWNIIEDSKTYNLSKSQVCAVHHLLLLLLFFPQKVSRNFVKLFMETPCWCTNMGHQYGGRKSTKTSGFHFWDKNAFFFLVS